MSSTVIKKNNFFRSIIRQERRTLLIILMCWLAWGIIQNTWSHLVKQIVDSANQNGPERMPLVLKYMALYILTAFIFQVVMRAVSWVTIHWRPHFQKRLYLSLNEQLTKHSYRYFQDNFAGNLTSKINDIVNFLPEIFVITIQRFIAVPFFLVAAIINMLQVDTIYSIMLVTWLTISLSASCYLIIRNNHLSKNAAESRSKIGAQIVDMVTNIINVRLFAKRDFELQQLAKVSTNMTTKVIKRDRFFFMVYLFQGVLFLCYQIASFYFLYKGLSNNTISAGAFVLIFRLNVSIVEQFHHMAEDINNVADMYGAVKQAIQMIYQPLEITDKKSAKPLVVSTGGITFDNVGFAYNNKKRIFRNFNLDIAPGTKIGLVGYSGGGKTTMINLLLRLFEPQSGQILIDGQNISSTTSHSLNQNIAVIPQDPTLFHRDLWHNIGYGANNEPTKEQIIQAAKIAHAHEFIRKLSKGYDSQVGERGIKLSGGQRQRIAIARAIIKDAPILILDEATSQLDSITEQQIQKSLTTLMSGACSANGIPKTTMVIAHRLSTLLAMDRILVFASGTIKEDGTHDQLIKANGIYAKLWNTQIGGMLRHQHTT